MKSATNKGLYAPKAFFVVVFCVADPFIFLDQGQFFCTFALQTDASSQSQWLRRADVTSISHNDNHKLITSVPQHQALFEL